MWGDLTPLSTKVAGIVRHVRVSDFQPVHKGDILVELEGKDYLAQVAQASAALEAAKATVENNRRQREVQGSRIARALAAVDDANDQIAGAQEFGLEGPLDRWVKLRSDIHGEVCRLGFSRELNSFVQYYGSKELDASLLMLPLVGFLPPEDPRVQGTVAAIDEHLIQDGLVVRYSTRSSVDGLVGNEGAFLACSFWMVDNYVLQGRMDEARSLFEHLLSLRNDVGLLAEEYDAKERRQLGNFPQAFSHLALVNSAHNLSAGIETRPAHDRNRTEPQG